MLTFSLGFGNKLIGKQWGETYYQLSAFPLGGYVKMYGEQAGEEVAEEDRAVSFSHKKVWQRFGIVFAGPLFNLLFAVFLFLLLFVFAGLPRPVDSTLISQVSPGSVAEKIGLAKGDIILAIDGQQTTSWEQVSELIRDCNGKELLLRIDRDGTELKVKARPAMEKVKNIFGEEVGERYLLGITRSDEVEYEQVSFAESVKAAFIQTWNMMYLTVMGIVKIIQQVVPASELGGPIRIAEIAGQQLKAGWMNFFYFMGMLSVNLGVVNLLPVPVLDGGHLVFLTIESIRRKPLSEESMLWAQKVGIALLASLMMFVFYNDIARIVHRWLTAS